MANAAFIWLFGWTGNLHRPRVTLAFRYPSGDRTNRKLLARE